MARQPSLRQRLTHALCDQETADLLLSYINTTIATAINDTLAKLDADTGVTDTDYADAAVAPLDQD